MSLLEMIKNMGRCPNCGESVSRELGYCPNCGAPQKYNSHKDASDALRPSPSLYVPGYEPITDNPDLSLSISGISKEDAAMIDSMLDSELTDIEDDCESVKSSPDSELTDIDEDYEPEKSPLDSDFFEDEDSEFFALLYGPSYVFENRKKQDGRPVCANCKKSYSSQDKYCRYCGAPMGKPDYIPSKIACIYGPPPVRRVHICENCGYSWETRNMVDSERFCPECGGNAPAIETEDDV